MKEKEQRKKDAMIRMVNSLIKFWKDYEYSKKIINEIKSKQGFIYIEFFDEYYTPIECIFIDKVPMWLLHFMNTNVDATIIFNTCNKYYVSSLFISKINELDNLYLDLQDISTNQKEYFKTYIMSCNGIYKIGKSRNPFNRLSQISSINPGTKLIFIFDDDIETILHVEYKSKLISNEWFNLSKKDLNKIYRDNKDIEIYLNS